MAIVGISQVRCCIVGGGPAGMMLGLLLARAGVEVAVLEKHADFLRDFRGDTIHPSTLQVMHELGLLDGFLRLPFQKAETLAARFGDETITVADFRRLPVRCPFIALMPQWDFLNFLAERAAAYPGFRLSMQTAAVDLLERGGEVVGVRATSPAGPLEIRADLVIGADGRHSLVREKSGLPVETLGAPMDVLWFHLAREAGDPDVTMGRFDAGRIFIMIDRADYWQCGYVIRKGGFEALRGEGLPAFRARVAALAGLAPGRVEAIDDWDKVKLLSVGVERMPRWCRPGLLCIGDAAHTMSPIGGVGVNLAIQDAVATANLLADALRAGPASLAMLHRVERRRRFPTRMTQALQMLLQRRVIGAVLAGDAPPVPPLPLRLLRRFPLLRRLPARLIGMGFRPEHIRHRAAPPAG